MVMLDVLVTLVVVSITANIAGSAITSLARATVVETARLRTLRTLLRARRAAYGAEGTAEVAVAAGADALTLRNPDGSTLRIELPPDTHVAHAAASGRVRFFGTGLADNATIVLATLDDAQQASVIVNQRGLLR